MAYLAAQADKTFTGSFSDWLDASGEAAEIYDSGALVPPDGPRILLESAYEPDYSGAAGRKDSSVETPPTSTSAP